MDVSVAITNALQNPAFIAVYLCLLFSVANFAIGSVKAWQNGSFLLTAFKAWVAKDGAALLPIFIWLVVGAAVGLVDVGKIGLPQDIASGALTAYGILQAATYLLATYGSMRDSLNPAAAQERKTKALTAAAAVGDEVPQT